MWAHTRPNPSIKLKFPYQRPRLLWGANQLSQKDKGGGFGPYQSPIETNILSTQIRACACPIGYFPLSHKSTKETTSNKKRSLCGQIALEEKHYHNKSPKMGPKWQLSSI